MILLHIVYVGMSQKRKSEMIEKCFLCVNFIFHSTCFETMRDRLLFVFVVYINEKMIPAGWGVGIGGLEVCNEAKR